MIAYAFMTVDMRIINNNLKASSLYLDMLLQKPSSLINILEYSNLLEILKIYVLNIYSKTIIRKSKLNNRIIDYKLRYLRNSIIANNKLITDCIKSFQNNCRHLYLLTDNKDNNDNKNNYHKQCIICNSLFTQSKYDFCNKKETNWQYYLRNENLQHELILRTDINKKQK